MNKELLKEKQKEFFDSATEDDLMSLMEGKKVNGYKLDKGQRREKKLTDTN